MLRLVQPLTARAMETDVSEKMGTRVCMGRHDHPQPQRRDHATLAWASAALGKDGREASQALRRHVANDCGFADATILSSAPTAQALPLGYPNAPGIIRGWAQRCGRALAQLKTRAVGEARRPSPRCSPSSGGSKNT